MKKKYAVNLRELLNEYIGFNLLKEVGTNIIEDFLEEYGEELINKICKKLNLNETFIRGIIDEDKS